MIENIVKNIKAKYIDFGVVASNFLTKSLTSFVEHLAELKFESNKLKEVDLLENDPKVTLNFNPPIPKNTPERYVHIIPSEKEISRARKYKNSIIADGSKEKFLLSDDLNVEVYPASNAKVSDYLPDLIASGAVKQVDKTLNSKKSSKKVKKSKSKKKAK